MLLDLRYVYRFDTRDDCWRKRAGSVCPTPLEDRLEDRRRERQLVEALRALTRKTVDGIVGVNQVARGDAAVAATTDPLHGPPLTAAL